LPIIEGKHPVKLGGYTACLHDKPVAEAIRILSDLGLESAEINSGGFLPAPHLPIEQIRSSQDVWDEYLGLFAAAGGDAHRAQLQREPAAPGRRGP
jgi:hypothetical protein